MEQTTPDRLRALWAWLTTPRQVRPVVMIALAGVIGAQWQYIATTPRNEDTSTAVWALGALACAGTAVYLFDRDRRRGAPGVPAGLFLALLSILLLQMALLFAAESVYGFLWRTFK